MAAEEITILTQRADKVDKNLTEGLKAVNTQISTLNERVDTVDSRIEAFETSFETLDTKFVTIDNFNKTVGNLDFLLNQQTTLIEKIDDINARLTWGDIPEINE